MSATLEPPAIAVGGMVEHVGTVTLEQSYEQCRLLNRRYGTTYYWATQTLPVVKRHHVHALYGFCRYADEIVDDLSLQIGGEDATLAARQAALDAFAARFRADVAAGASEDPVLKAVVHTIAAFDLDLDLFDRFLRSMRMDLSVSTYETWEDLRGYMDGSAAVIGEMMLPILEPVDLAAARPHARDLGDAFQLTNFLRDVAEDLDRGRVYLPQEDIRRFGVNLDERRVTPEWIELCRFEAARCHELYASADLGIDMLSPRSAGAIRAARVLYGGILERIEAAGYDVFSRRARVPLPRKLAIAARETRRARRAG